MSEQTATETQTTLFTSDAVGQLIALAAAVASNAERAFEAHHQRLTQLGVSREDMIKAVNIGLRVKGDPHQSIIEMAEAALVGKSGCCGGGNCSDEADCGDGGCGEGGCGCH